MSDAQTPADSATKALSILIPADLVISTASLPDGQLGAAYSQTASLTGGVAPYSWSVSAGSLPAGLSLNASTGAIAGTPTAYGASSFTLQVTDDQTPADTATKALSITVVPATLSVTTASLASGKVAVAYSETLAASGGATPLSWDLSAGSLPAGLSLDAATGVISGTPTAYGTAAFTARVTDSWTPANTASKALSIIVAPVDLAISTAALADGQVGAAYSQTLASTGGAAPVAWSLSAGALPAGLSLDSATGVVSGTPTACGTASFTVRAIDAWTPAGTATRALSITVVPADLAITTTTAQDGR